MVIVVCSVAVRMVSGSYGMIMTKYGCPDTATRTWNFGYMEVPVSGDHVNLLLDTLGSVNDDTLTLRLCVSDDGKLPITAVPGCVFRTSQHCPTGNTDFKGMEYFPNIFMSFDKYLFLEVINILV